MGKGKQIAESRDFCGLTLPQYLKQEGKTQKDYQSFVDNLKSKFDVV